VTDPNPKTVKRRWWKYLLVLVLVGLVVLGGALWYMTTESFQAFVRARMVAEIEKATGARVELGTYHTIPFRLQAEVRDLTLHGLEANSEVPLAHVDRVVARIKVISLLQTSFGFKWLYLEHPVVHLIVHPDGSTNVPEPPVKSRSTRTPVEEFFALSINRLVVRRGEFLWNDQRTPFDFDGNDISTELAYSFFHGRYESNVQVGKVDTRYQDFLPFSWRASAHFSLGKNDLEVGWLKWASGDSHVEASGRITNFSRPSLECRYSAVVDLTQAGAILQQRELHAGFFEAEGKGAWSLEKFATDGKLALKNFEWKDDRVVLRDASLAGEYSVSSSQIKLSKAQGRALGGSIAGDAEITNWMSSQLSSSNSAKQKRPEEERGIIHLRMREVPASAIASAFSSRRYPLDRLKLAGTADGTVNLQWRGSPQRGEADFAFNLVPPPRTEPSQVPVTATARGVYRASAEELELTQFDVATRSTQLHANGKLAASSSLQLSAATTDLSELQPRIVALGGPGRLPVDVRGSARFTGAASGKINSATLAGHLQVQDFDALIPATAHTAEQTIHWGSLAADMQVSPHSIAARHVTAVHGDSIARFDASATLTRGEFSPNDAFTVSLDLQNADIAEVQSILGYAYPVSGRANLTLQASGTRAQPHAEGHVHIADAVVYGQPFRQFDSDLRWDGHQASLNNAHVSYQDAQASGGAAYDFDSHTFQLNVAGQNLDLARIPRLQSTRVPVDGRVDFTAQASGTLEAPVLNAKIRVRDLALDHERTGDLNIDAVSEGEAVRLSARSEFEHAQFDLEGTVVPRKNYPADLTLRFEHLDLDSIFRDYLNGRVTGHSGVSGEVQIRGDLRRPRDLNAIANLDGFEATVDDVRLRNEGPIRLSVSQETAHLERFRIVGENTDFSAHGTASLASGHDLDLASEGHLNLQLIQTLNANFTSSGLVDISLTASGPINDPLLQGRVNISHGSLAYSDLPSGLSDMNGSLVFNKNSLQIETLTAHSGGGTLNLTGGASTYQGQINFDFSANAQDVRLRYPAGVSSTANADLRFFGSQEGSTLTGDVTITKLAITPGFDFAAYAAGSSQSVVVPPATSPLYKVKLDVHVVTAPDLQMQTAIARLSGDADLRLRGTAAKPALLGRVEVLEGDINFNGTKYRLERGEVLFKNPVGIQPSLDLQATTRVREYDITVSINGETSKPLSVKYRADPPLPEADIVALLAVGQTREQSAQMAQAGSTAFSQTASNLILTEALNSTVSNRVQRLLGVSKIKIDPQGLSTETNPTRGPQVTIEQQISNNFTLTYSQNVSQASQQIIQGEYYIRRNVSIVGTRDQNGVVSFDVKIRQRKK
jgi:translocation and assembly module TamB